MSERVRVLLAVPLPPDLLERIQAAADVDACFPPFPVERGAVLERLPGARALLCSNLLPIDSAILDAGSELRAICNIGVGYDNVDLEDLGRRRIVVTNTPDVLTDAVAEYTIGLIITLARRITDAAQCTRSGGWTPETRFPMPMGMELGGKTLSIIGLGRIGSAVARRAGVFGLRLLYNDIRPVDGAAVGAEEVTLEEALGQGDFVSLHVNLWEGSRGLIGARELALMKPSAYLVNTARGPVVREEDLYRALADGRIAGAALDVTDPEPPLPGNPLLALPNVIVTPHYASGAVETRVKMATLAVENLLSVLAGRCPPSAVNPEAWTVN